MIKIITIMYFTTNNLMQEMHFFFYLYVVVYVCICICLANRFYPTACWLSLA